MIDVIIITTFVLVAAGIGFNSIDLLSLELQKQIADINSLRWLGAFCSSILGLIFGLVAQTTYRNIETYARTIPIEFTLTRSMGLITGLIITNLTLAPIFLLPIPQEFTFIKPMAAILGSTIFSFMGVSIAGAHQNTILRLINFRVSETWLAKENKLQAASVKIIDTSCIIDGRIEKLVHTGFIEGRILIPRFVLDELHILADNNNNQKRFKGRRGLDILNRMQRSNPESFSIYQHYHTKASTIDAKLIDLAKEINGILLTNDHNLSKVATLQKVNILNINDIVEASRSIYLPEDILHLKIIKSGQETSQWVGYLEDGTIVVIKEGEKYVGKTTSVSVTSVIQTSTGRMIFAKIESIIS